MGRSLTTPDTCQPRWRPRPGFIHGAACPLLPQATGVTGISEPYKHMLNQNSYEGGQVCRSTELPDFETHELFRLNLGCQSLCCFLHWVPQAPDQIAKNRALGALRKQVFNANQPSGARCGQTQRRPQT